MTAPLVLSPSDLAAGGPHRVFVPDAETVRVGGRVVVAEVAGARSVSIADAFASVAVEFEGDGGTPDADALAHGELVVVEGRASERGLARARILERKRGAASPRDVARLRDAGVGRTLADRARALEAVRETFAKERFVEVETPLAVPSPGLDLHLDAFALDAKDRWLITSPEYQMKRMLVGGFPRCFQIARCFRRGEIGGRHNPEFTMLEWYRAFAGMDAIVEDSERLVRAVARVFGRRTLTIAGREIEIEAPFRRISIVEAFRDLAATTEDEMLSLANDDEEAFFRLLVDEVEPKLAESPVPIVLHRYPAKMASLARLAPDDPRYAERFEIYAGGLELSNGFVELTDATEQRARLERDQRERREQGLAVYPIDERFLEALEGGMPDAAGNAMGLDRLIMIASGKERIADVLAFPEGEL